MTVVTLNHVKSRFPHDLQWLRDQLHAFFERVCGALIRHMQGALIIIGPLRSEWFSP